MTPAGQGPYGPQGHGWQDEDHYTLLVTKYESSGPCGIGEKDFLCFSHCKSMGANDPRGGAIFDPRGWQDLYRGLLNIATYKI